MLGFVFPKKSSIKDIFDREIQWMRENGELTQQLVIKHSRKTPNCANKESISHEFENIMSSFGIIIFGIAASTGWTKKIGISECKYGFAILQVFKG